MMNFVFKASKLLSIRSNNINRNIVHKLTWQQLRYYDETEGNPKNKDIIAEIKAKKRLRNKSKIKLIYPDKSVTIITLEEAEKIAIRETLCLMHTPEKSKGGRTTYTLINVAEDLNKDLETDTEKKTTKPTKLFSVKSNIANHDLMVKINNMNKILKRNCNVKIFLNHPDGIKEELLQNIKQKVQGTLLTKQSKKIVTILQYSPLLNDTKTSEENDNK